MDIGEKYIKLFVHFFLIPVRTTKLYYQGCTVNCDDICCHSANINFNPYLPWILWVTPAVFRHTVLTSKKDREAIVCVANRKSIVEKVTKVNELNHSMHLAGTVTVKRITLFIRRTSFVPTAVAGCTGPQSTCKVVGEHSTAQFASKLFVCMTRSLILHSVRIKSLMNLWRY